MGLLSSLLGLLGCAKKSELTEPPIQNLDSFDIVGKRNDGGVDLIIISSAHLDGSSETRSLLERKIRNYLRELSDPGFRAEFGEPSPEKVAIILTCVDRPAPAILSLIKELQASAAESGASLVWRLYEEDR